MAWIGFILLLAQSTAAQIQTPNPGALPANEPPGAESLPYGLAEMRGDARLNDVCFPDAQHGWAVGDRGAVWHTEDGGRHWELQESGVAWTLESVWFVGPQVGWAAGGFSSPYLHDGAGVILRTEDGGCHWTRVRDPLLPAIKKIRFSDAKRGWATGCPSTLVPGGAIVTDTGGRSWRTPAGGESERWRAGDPGATWQAPPGSLPERLQAEFDWAAVAVRGSRVWMAGSPGTRILHSPDAGRTWSAFATGQSLPLRAITFVDDRRGWAVGALGTVLHTDDGGHTWRPQWSGGARAAVLGIFSTAEDLPLELFALLCGNDGYLGVVDVLNRQDVEVPPRGYVPLADRLREAALAVGGSDAELARRFPLRQPGLRMDARAILDGWDRANEGRGLDALRAYLVRQIRTWRPDVVVTHDASPRGEDPLSHLVNQAVLQAVEEAADPASYPRQIAQAGLAPWQVRKLYAALAPGTRGVNDLSGKQLAIRLGRSLGDVATDARGLLADRFTAPPQVRGFRLLMDRLTHDQPREDFFAGIVLSPGGDARRPLGQPPAEGIAALRQITEKRRLAEAILARCETDSLSSLQLLAQTDRLLGGLDAASAAPTLYQMADRYLRAGRMAMAADTLDVLVRRYPQHPLASAASLWLLQYYASGEAAWRERQAPQAAVQQTTMLSVDASRQDDRSRQAADLAAQLQRAQPELFAEPAIGFSLAVVDRRAGRAKQAEPFYAAQRHRTTHDAWWACAQGEVWLAHRTGPAPKPVLHCVRAASKPRLDGKFDETLWKQAQPGTLASAQQDDAQWPAQVMLAHDDRFLYIAIQCACAPGVAYQDSPGPRPRDPDLSAHDRVDLLIDLDRDYASYWRLTIDHRGWTGEECWGDRTWNPDWFVAASRANGVWTAEAAIPLAQLTGQTPRPGEVWAIGVQRTAPGAGFQSWSAPAAVDVAPEGFGYLMFE